MRYLLLLLPLAFSLNACYYDNKEDLYPFAQQACDIQTSSYLADVVPILEQYCTVCHNAADPQGNIDLSSYQQVKIHAESGTLLGSIRYDPAYVGMPQGSTLAKCTIEQIEVWVNGGAPEN